MQQAWIVSRTDYDDYEQHGVFSTREKAQAYIDMVGAAQAEAGIKEQDRTYLDLDEIEMDDLTDRIPVFYVEIWAHDKRIHDDGILYLAQVPKTYVSKGWAVKIYDRSYKNVRARIPETRRLYFSK